MMNNIKKYIKIFATAAAFAVMLSACGNKNSSTAYSEDYVVAETSAAMAEMPMMAKSEMAEENAAGIYMDNGIVDGEFGGVLSDTELAAEALSEEGGVLSDTEPASGISTEDSGKEKKEKADSDGEKTADKKTTERKLIRNIYLEMETKEYDKLTSGIISRINSFGGYIESSNEYHPGINDKYSKRNINLTARIPSDRLQEFVSGVEAEGNITYKSENVTDVTLNYTDTESKKKSLEIERDRLMELMKEAESVDAIIAIESRLSEIRYEIDSRESQLRVYDNQVEYSMVSICITEVEVLSMQTEVSLSQRLLDGIKQNLRDLSKFFESAFIGVVTHLPSLAFIAAITTAIVLGVKAGIKKRKTSEKEMDEKEKSEKEKDEQKKK